MTPDGQQTCINIPVSGIPNGLNYDLGLTGVTLSLTNPDLSDVEISLISPSGNTYILIDNNDISGTILSNVTISSLGTPIDDAFPPYSGNYRPDTYGLKWCDINDNINVGDGVWQVCIDIPSWGDPGNLLLVELDFGYGGESNYVQQVAVNDVNDLNIPLICCLLYTSQSPRDR